MLTREWLESWWPGDWYEGESGGWCLDIITDCLVASIYRRTTGAYRATLVADNGQEMAKVLWEDEVHADARNARVLIVRLRNEARGMAHEAMSVVGGPHGGPNEP